MGSKKETNTVSVEAKPVEVFYNLALKLRKPGVVEWRETVTGRTRVEYFRGKDLLEYVNNNPTALDEAVEGIPNSQNMTPLHKVEIFISCLLLYKLAFPADRTDADKVPKDGKIVKWPKRLVPLPPTAQGNFNPKAFYVWSFPRPLSPWSYVGSAGLVLLVVMGCLYPLAPVRMKWIVLYLVSGVLAVLLGLASIRALLYVVIWLATGRHVWFLPLLFEDVSVKESFSVLIGESKEADGKPVERSKIWVRLGVVFAIIGLVLAAQSLAPHRKKAAARMRMVNASVMEFFETIRREEKEKIGPDLAKGEPIVVEPPEQNENAEQERADCEGPSCEKDL